MPRLAQIDSSSIERTIKQLVQIDGAGVERTLKELWQTDAAGVPRRVYSAFSASASPALVQGFGNSPGNISITTSAYANCAPDSGTAPYSYSWATTDPDFVAVYPASASTPFTGSSVGPGTEKSASFTCTVTDAVGQVAISNSVTATVTNTNAS